MRSQYSKGKINTITIQTHNAVSVGASNSSNQANFMDCEGFDKIAITLLNDTAVSSSIALLWSNDNSSIHGYEASLATGNNQQKVAITDIKARYCKMQVWNNDTIAHTMSIWAYLKA